MPSHYSCAQDIGRKFAKIQELKDHLKAVRMDRDLEQLLQSRDPVTADRPCLFLQVDGMDQAKWSLPRIFHHRGSKDLQKFVRPRLKIVGAWCSGILLTLYVVDANFAHDASLTCEASWSRPWYTLNVYKFASNFLKHMCKCQIT